MKYQALAVSINPHWWDWPGDVPPTRVRGRIIKWVSKRVGIEQLSIEWELGSGDDGYIAGQGTYDESELSDLSKPSAAMGKFLSDSQYAFTLEPYVNGTHKRMSYVTDQYVRRARNVAESQYVSIKSALERTLGPHGWTVSQRNFIAGARSLNEKDLHDNLAYFKVPQAGIDSIR